MKGIITVLLAAVVLIVGTSIAIHDFGLLATPTSFFAANSDLRLENSVVRQPQGLDAITGAAVAWKDEPQIIESKNPLSDSPTVPSESPDNRMMTVKVN